LSQNKSLVRQDDSVSPAKAITVDITAINSQKRIFLPFLKKIALFLGSLADMRFSGKGTCRSSVSDPRPEQA
jgi:hypothetical protein